MTDTTDISALLYGLRCKTLPELTPEQDLALRRMLAGRRNCRPDNPPPTRTTDGEWMWRTTLDLPEAMQLELEALATAQGLPENQIVREALVAFGIGRASHIVGVQDGTCSDDRR